MIGLDHQNSSSSPKPKRHGGNYFVEYYHDKKGDWRWRFVYQRGQMRRIMSESSEGYRRRVNAEKCFNSTRLAPLVKVIIPRKRSGQKHTSKPAAGQ